jgi:hypothetical protein
MNNCRTIFNIWAVLPLANEDVSDTEYLPNPNVKYVPSSEP